MDKQIKCAQQVMNYSSISLKDRFDKPKFNSNEMINKLHVNSPKLVELLKNIKRLDTQDYKKCKKLYKHFIYSSVGNGYGSKIIASAMIASGYTLVNKKNGINVYGDNESKFALLSSTAIYDKPITPKTIKEILNIFNKRPDNVYGENIRFIILDSGFKEGIDLYDVKYCHLFEDNLYESDFIQSVGRANRFKGFFGFKNTKIWTLEVFKYISVIIQEGIIKNKQINILEILKNYDKQIKMNTNLTQEIDRVIKKNAIDYYLNKNINEYDNINENKSRIIPLIATIGSISGLSLMSLLAFHKLRN